MRPRFGAAAVAACVGLVALLLAAPFLYSRIGETGQRLNSLLRSARVVRQDEAARVARIRAEIDGRLRESSRAHDEILTFIESGVQRMLPRPIYEMKLPDTMPLPKGVQPSVQPYATAPSPQAGVYEPPASAEPAPTDPSAAELVDSWIDGMTRSLGLTAVQRERCREVCTEYLTQVRSTLESERQRPSGQGVELLRRTQDTAIRRIESILTAEQRVTYERLEHDTEVLRKAGVVVPPLPGSRGTRSGPR
ncbi:MAG: hypothetical protein AAB434_10520 [Planctomycetota bacterium]